MSMHTDIRISFSLVKYTPSEVHKVLGYMLRGDHDQKGMTFADQQELNALLDSVPNCGGGHRIHHMLCSGEDLVTGGQPVTAHSYDEAHEKWHFTIVRSIKNYAKEWQTFIKWIAPYVDSEIGVCKGDYLVLGTMFYEEWDYPKLILVKDGEVKYQWITVREEDFCD